METDLVLLIWEERPERIRYFALPQIEADSEWYILHQAHGVMINGTENDEYAFKVFGCLEKAEDTKNTGTPRAFDGKWVRFEVEEAALPTLHITKVYKSGFIL